MRMISLFFLLTCINIHIYATEFYEKWYDYYVEDLKELLKNGSTSLGIPKLDPYYINTTFNLDTTKYRIQMHLNGLLSNFSNFYIDNLNINPNLESTIEIKFVSIYFAGSYNLNGEIMKVIPLEGVGHFEIYIGNLMLLTEYQVCGRNRTLQLSNFKLSYDVGVSEFYVDGLLKKYFLNNIIEHFLGDVIPSGLNLLRYQIQQFVNQLTLESGNKWLSTMDPKHVVEVIKSFIK